MKKIEVSRGGYDTPSVVYFEQSLSRMHSLLEGEQSVVVVTNPMILELYAEQLSPYRVITVNEGEAHKTMESVAQVHRELLALGCDRGVFLCGFGGGIITDITGFVASTYMRGVRFGFVATSLLAQVDASVGGKNGVNLDGYKNIVGTFNQPDWVICPVDVLSSLPPRELIAGYSEIIKVAIIDDPNLFEMFEGGEVDLPEAIYRSVRIKADIVERDEKEKGERKLLNLGHTFAHAIEKCSSGAYLHGEAVAVGMVMAADLGITLGLCDAELRGRIVKVLERVGLPVEAPGFSQSEIIEVITTDKKRSADSISFIVPAEVGVTKIQKIEIKKLVDIL